MVLCRVWLLFLLVSARYKLNLKPWSVPGCCLPYALDRKYPNAGKSWVWQYVFPSGNRSVDPRSGQTRRHHLDEQTIQRAVKQAVRSADLSKPATPLRSATHSRRICCSPLTTFAPSSNCSVMPMCSHKLGVLFIGLRWTISSLICTLRRTYSGSSIWMQ